MAHGSAVAIAVAQIYVELIEGDISCVLFQRTMLLCAVCGRFRDVGCFFGPQSASVCHMSRWRLWLSQTSVLCISGHVIRIPEQDTCDIVLLVGRRDCARYGFIAGLVVRDGGSSLLATLCGGSPSGARTGSI